MTVEQFAFSLSTGPAVLTTAGLFLIPGAVRARWQRWRIGSA